MNPFAKDPEIPFYAIPECGLFGAQRRHDVHLGVDIYMKEGTEVILPKKINRALLRKTGSSWTVKRIENFTGVNSVPPSPWWNETQAVFLENEGLVLIFGEISTDLSVGDLIEEGDVIGKVMPVLKKENGMPNSMLHIESWYSSVYTRFNMLPYSGFSLESQRRVNGEIEQFLFFQDRSGANRIQPFNRKEVDELFYRYATVKELDCLYFGTGTGKFLSDYLAENLVPGDAYLLKMPPISRVDVLSHYMYGRVQYIEGPDKGFNRGLSDHAPFIFLEKKQTKSGYTILRFLQESFHFEGSNILSINGSFRASMLFTPLTPTVP